MSKKYIFSFASVCLLIVLSAIFLRSKHEEVVVFTSSGSYRSLTLDEVIEESEIIVIGKVNAILPSVWMAPGGKDLKNATPQEIFDAEGLFTDSVFSIEKVVKGDNHEQIIRVRSFVGETKNAKWVDNTQPSFKQDVTYLLLLKGDIGPSSQIESGYYVPVNALQGVFEIVDGKAISLDSQWNIDELINYIQNKLSEPELSSTEVPIETATP